MKNQKLLMLAKLALSLDKPSYILTSSANFLANKDSLNSAELKSFTYIQSYYPTPYVRKKSKGNTKWKERISQFKRM